MYCECLKFFSCVDHPFPEGHSVEGCSPLARLESMKKYLSELHANGLKVKYRYKSTHWYYMADLETAMRGVKNAIIRAGQVGKSCGAMYVCNAGYETECMREEDHRIHRDESYPGYHEFKARCTPGASV